MTKSKRKIILSHLQALYQQPVSLTPIMRHMMWITRQIYLIYKAAKHFVLENLSSLHMPIMIQCAGASLQMQRRLPHQAMCQGKSIVLYVSGVKGRCWDKQFHKCWVCCCCWIDFLLSRLVPVRLHERYFVSAGFFSNWNCSQWRKSSCNQNHGVPVTPPKLSFPD